LYQFLRSASSALLQSVLGCQYNLPLVIRRSVNKYNTDVLI
jgi:hypothetical protein